MSSYGSSKAKRTRTAGRSRGISIASVEAAKAAHERDVARAQKAAAKGFASDLQRKDALYQMATGRTYIANGQVRLKENRSDGYHETGPIAQWNTAARNTYGSAQAAKAAADRWLTTPEGRLHSAESRLMTQYTQNYRPRVVRDEARLNAMQREELARWRSGDLTPPKLEPRAQNETPQETFARVHRDKARYDIWEHAVGNLDTTVVRNPVGTRRGGRSSPWTPVGHVGHRLGQRESAAKERLRRSDMANFNRTAGTTVQRQLTSALRGSARGTIRLDQAIQRAEERAAPGFYQAAHGHTMEDHVQFERSFGRDLMGVMRQREADALRTALVGRDVQLGIVSASDRYKQENAGTTTPTPTYTVHGHVADVSYDPSSRSVSLMLSGPADNPRSAYHIWNGNRSQEPASRDRREAVYVSDIATLRSGAKRTAAASAQLAARVHAERSANPLYAAFHAGTTMTVRRPVDAGGSYQPRNVTMTPKGFDGTHFTVEETYKANGRTVTRTEQWTPAQLEDNMSTNWQHWQIVGTSTRARKSA